MIKLGFRLLLLVLFPLVLKAEPAAFEESFRKGLAASQEQKHEEAQKHFETALQEDQRSAAAMANLAYTFTHLGKWGEAIAWYRRALAQDPGYRPAREGLEYSLTKLEVKEIPHRIESFETLRTYFLQYISLPQFLGLGLLFLFLSGWRWLSWLGARRRSLRDEGEAPPPISFVTLLLTLMFLLSVVGSALKVHDISSPRATVIAKKVDVFSAPGGEGVVLFELHEGFEVIIGAIKEDWVQVTYPGGLTGWIARKDLIPLEGDL